jgi:hypothetical protein
MEPIKVMSIKQVKGMAMTLKTNFEGCVDEELVKIEMVQDWSCSLLKEEVTHFLLVNSLGFFLLMVQIE